MNIGLVDLIIIIVIGLGGLVGYKNGAIKEGTKFLGFFIVIIISFILKDSLMVMLYENLPFFGFFGIIQGIDAINILFYQLVSFLIIFAALMFILKVLVVITGLVELLVKMTVFLSFPSRILGAIVGAIEFYVYLFLILYVLNMPVFNLTYVNDSTFGQKILNNTPILSSLVDDTVSVYADVWQIVKNKEGRQSKEINTMVLTSLLEHKLITLDSAKKLLDTNKIIVSDDNLLEKYKEDDNLYEELKKQYFNKKEETSSNNQEKTTINEKEILE